MVRVEIRHVGSLCCLKRVENLCDCFEFTNRHPAKLFSEAEDIFFSVEVKLAFGMQAFGGRLSKTN